MVSWAGWCWPPLWPSPLSSKQQTRFARILFPCLHTRQGAGGVQAKDHRGRPMTEFEAATLTAQYAATLTAIVGGAQCLLIYLGLQRVIEWNS